MESKIRILVVDDEQGLRDMLSYELGSQGYYVATAADGEEGIARVKEEKFDLIILDLKMPRLGGIQALEQIKKIDPEVEIIVATGYGTIETAVESMKKGAYDYINKPFDIDELTVLIHKALEKIDLKFIAALYKTTKILFSSMDMNILLKMIINLIITTIKADDTSIILFDTNQKLYMAASYNIDDEIKIKNRIEAGERALIKIIRKKEAFIKSGSGIEDFPEFAGISSSEEIKSSLYCPLLTKTKVLGIISFNRIKIEDNFTQTDLRNVNIFAAQIAQAIENAQINTAIKEAGQKIEESYNFIESVIGSMTDALVVVDCKGKIIKINRAMIRLFLGKEIDTHNTGIGLLIGKIITEILPLKNFLVNPAGEFIGTRLPVSGYEQEYRSEHEERIIPLSLSAAPLFDSNRNITGTVIIIVDITYQKEIQKSLKYMAMHDSLTNLPNRLLLNDRVFQAISRACRYKHQVAVLLFKVDQFKEVNHRFGFDTANCLLKQLTVRVSGCLRNYDTLARMGGDQFAIILGEMSGKEHVKVIASRVIRICDQPFVISSNEIRITISMGISMYPTDADNIEILLKYADKAMCIARKVDSDRFSFFTTRIGKALEEKEITEEILMKAMDLNQFVIHYQPLIETETNKIVAAEALIRWQHPKYELIDPLNFLGVAETTKMILPIGKWVIRNACIQSKTWQDKGFGPLPIAVNLSALQLYDPGLIPAIEQILKETGLDPCNLILEITESSTTYNIEESVRITRELAVLGIKIFIDDFGSGYSSLNRLMLFPIHSIKIDKFFIQHIVSDSFNASIVRAIILMAHSLNIKVIAKDIETLEQLDFLKSFKLPDATVLKCDHFQGHLFSEPLRSSDFTLLLSGAN